MQTWGRDMKTLFVLGILLGCGYANAATIELDSTQIIFSGGLGGGGTGIT